MWNGRSAFEFESVSWVIAHRALPRQDVAQVN